MKGKTMEILVAEDDFCSRRVLENLIIASGHEAVSAGNGLEAWQLFQGNGFRMVITDWMMPGLDGLELCKRIRSFEKDGYTYLILLTAKGEKENLVQGLGAGADDYIKKPFEVQEVQARIKAGERLLRLESEHRKNAIDFGRKPE